jgi:hypothetical protein
MVLTGDQIETAPCETCLCCFSPFTGPARV